MKTPNNKLTQREPYKNGAAAGPLLTAGRDNGAENVGEPAQPSLLALSGTQVKV